jgi:GNAT superfamily N-acetyltransferase
MNDHIVKPVFLPVFPDVPGKRVWRHDLYQGPSNWRPDSNENKFGPRTSFADGIYIVTISENIPVERIDLFLKARFAARDSRYDFDLGDNYDAAVAVYKGRIVGLGWADTGYICQWRWRLALKPHLKFIREPIVAAKGLPIKRDPNKIYGRPAVIPTEEELHESVSRLEPPYRPMVRGIWVHPQYRGLGIGGQLISALAQHFYLRVDEIGYRLPVSAKATRMLQSMGLHTIFGEF